MYRRRCSRRHGPSGRQVFCTCGHTRARGRFSEQTAEHRRARVDVLECRDGGLVLVAGLPNVGRVELRRGRLQERVEYLGVQRKPIAQMRGVFVVTIATPKTADVCSEPLDTTSERLRLQRGHAHAAPPPGALRRGRAMVLVAARPARRLSRVTGHLRASADLGWFGESRAVCVHRASNGGIRGTPDPRNHAVLAWLHAS